MTCEGETIQNLLVEGGLENFMPIFDSLFPYATDASADDEVPFAYELSGPYLTKCKKHDPLVPATRKCI